MTHEELRAWCYGEMRALAGSPMHARGEAFLKLLDASLAPPWLADAAEALGEVRPDDGAPLALHWTQVITAIHELREDRDHWKKRGEAAEFSLSMCRDELAAIRRCQAEEADFVAAGGLSGRQR